MATRFPKFEVHSEDPTTRRIWYSIGTAHDLESHDDITTEALYQKICFSFWSFSNYFLDGQLIYVAWQNFEQWILNH
jgi:hypothetical protein